MAELIVLGAGVPTPVPERFGTSFVLNIENEFIMFDCGPATTHKLVKTGLKPTQIDHLFFTHHHSDHNVDYPCFVLCRWDQSTGKENMLNVYGPPPTQSLSDKLFGENGAFTIDWQARVNGPVSQMVHKNRGGSLPRPPLKINVSEIKAGDEIKGKTWTIRTAKAHHLEPWLESIAYRIDTQHGSIVILGDTGPCENLSALSKGCDVLVANCWDLQETMEANGEAPGQTGTIDAANFARDAGAKVLILAHMGARISAPDSIKKALVDIGRIYSGKVIVSREMMSIDIL